MRHNCFVTQSPVVPIVVSSYEVLTTEQVKSHGRILNRSKYVVDNPSERYQGLKPLDFCLENQIAVGADLKEVYMDSGCFTAVASLPIVNI